MKQLNESFAMQALVLFISAIITHITGATSFTVESLAPKFEVIEDGRIAGPFGGQSELLECCPEWHVREEASPGCLVLSTRIAPITDSGISFVPYPEQRLLWVQLHTDTTGSVAFRHRLLRLGGGGTLNLSADIVGQQADWRGDLRWLTRRYSEIFNPPNACVHQMVGTGSNSRTVLMPSAGTSGNVVTTWGGAVAMDSGDPNYQTAFLCQVRLMKYMPDFDGVAIDSMDWLPNVNHTSGTDDHIGRCHDGRPGRYFGWSWIETLAKVLPIPHSMDITKTTKTPTVL